MKIGVITYWWCFENYGQLLQAFSFQRFLMKRGHDAFLIKWTSNTLTNGRVTIARMVSSLLHPIKLTKSIWMRLNGTVYRVVVRRRYVEPRRNFDSFRNNYLRFTNSTYYTADEINASAEAEADLYSVGSDVIWKYALVNNVGRIVFLDFGRNDSKRIAYSPSFGGSTLSESYKNFAQPFLKRFDLVSVREQSGVALCGEMDRKDAICVVDPVFLLSCAEWRSLFHIPNVREGYLVYLLKTKQKFDFACAKKIAGGDRLLIVTVYDDFGLPAEDLSNPTIEEWLRFVGTGKCVFTNSFHCVSLCIIFHTPFVAFLKEKGKGMDDRVLSILNRAGLLDRVSSGVPAETERISKESINWSMVDKRLSNEIEKSKEFLLRAGI